MIRTVLLFAALTLSAPSACADANLVTLTGKDGKPAEYGYSFRTVESGKKKLIFLELSPAAAKAFDHGKLTLTKGGQTVVTATVTIVKDARGNGTPRKSAGRSRPAASVARSSTGRIPANRDDQGPPVAAIGPATTGAATAGHRESPAAK